MAEFIEPAFPQTPEEILRNLQEGVIRIVNTDGFMMGAWVNYYEVIFFNVQHPDVTDRPYFYNRFLTEAETALVENLIKTGNLRKSPAFGYPYYNVESCY